MSTKQKPITASELMAELAADPEYQARLAEKEQIRLEKSARLGVAEEPLVQALNAIGLDITSVWDLVSTHERYDAALPVLAEHLERDYPPEIQEGIARAMAVPESMKWREDFIRLFRNLPRMPEGKRDGVRDGLAVAIGNTTGPHNVWETMELLRDPLLGESRIFMLRVLGKAKESEVREALLELRERDPQLRNAISDLSWVKKLDRERKQAVTSSQRH